MNDFLKFIENKIKNDFFVRTLNKVSIEEKIVGYILVSEQANEIVVAVKERKDFIIRTVLAVALVILIFSVFLNKYILKPISFLVRYTESIKSKSSKNFNQLALPSTVNSELFNAVLAISFSSSTRANTSLSLIASSSSVDNSTQPMSA
jgi:signal transduction histidine kinase